MAELSQTDRTVHIEAIKAKLDSVSESLNRCFDSSFQLQLAESQEYSKSPPGMDLLQPGVVVSLWVGAECLLCAIPESLPLPEWYTQPDPNQQVRLDSLAMEWATHCLPDELPGETFTSDVVPSVWESISACEISQQASWLPIDISTAEGPSPARVWLLWPSATSPRESTPQWDPGPGGSPEGEEAFESGASHNGTATAVESMAAPVVVDAKYAARRQTLLSLPVRINVQLAKKKIELGQLMNMGPGTIVTFEKSCEDLLDLYINNQLYCRGEAVKIGEKFGIKINEIGSIEERVSAVLSWGS